MSITFYIVRHAMKEKAIGDVSITPEGVEQARRTGSYFSSIPITAIFSSPLQRAKETARYISLQTESVVEVDDRLRERANWGDLPGQTFEEFVTMWDRCTIEPDYIPPIGDSARHACHRLSSLLCELVEEYPSGSHIILVAHGGLITDYVANSFPEYILNTFHPHFIREQSQLVAECSITKLNFKRDGFSLDRFSLDSFASVKHLKGSI